MIQGLELISKFSNDEDHNISILEVLDNWSGGCSIRSNLLSELKKEFGKNIDVFSCYLQNVADRCSVFVQSTKNSI